MRLNIKIFKNVITIKTISIKKIYCAFVKIKLITTLKIKLIRDLDILKNR